MPLRPLVVLAMLVAAAANAQEPPFSESIIVGRTLLSVRIVDRNGRAILGLQPEDFVTTIDGKPAELTSVTWIPENGERDLDPEFLDALAENDWLTPPNQARLFILYFQTDFARNSQRVGGQLNALLYVDKIVDKVLQPEDLVAVVSFDSRLRFHLDFTADKKQVRKAARQALEIGEPPTPPAVPGPSLAACLDREAMRRANHDEAALLVLAQALRDIPGQKQMMFFGTHLGHQVGYRIVVMDRLWEQAKNELIASNVVVNAFYSMAPGLSGSLSVNVQKTASATGGFFVAASPRGLKRIQEGELAGHYELELKVPNDLDIGVHQIAIRGKTRKEIEINATLTVTPTNL